MPTYATVERIGALIAALALSACGDPAPATPVTTVASTELRVPMVRRGLDGTFTVPVAVAGVCCFPFLVDSGAADVAVSPRLFRALMREGHVTRADLIDVVRYTTASGEVEGIRFRMPPMTLGGITVHNVIGSVTPDVPDNMLLLGQSFLRRFRSWTIDNTTHELVLR